MSQNRDKQTIMTAGDRLRIEGFEEGKQKAQQKTAIIMIRDNESHERVMRYTGISLETYELLLERVKQEQIVGESV